MSNVRTYGPMKPISQIILLASLAVAAPAALSAESMSCTYTSPLPPGKRITNIDLTAEAGAVVSVGYLGMFTTGMETPGYNCHFDATKKNTTWTRKGTKSIGTVIDEFGEKSTFSVTASESTYRIEFEDMGLNWCGAQAEFPRNVEITKGVKKCRVQY